MSGHSKVGGHQAQESACRCQTGQSLREACAGHHGRPRVKAGEIPTTTRRLPRPSSRPKTPNMPTTTSPPPSRRAAERGPTAETYLHLTYEGYGPAGVAVYVTALTDNKNRTAADVRYLFDRSGGQAGHRRLGQLDVRAQGRHLPGRRGQR